MNQHEIIPLFGKLWWQSNLISVAVIVGIIYTGKVLSQPNRERLAWFLGIVFLAREVAYHLYMVHIGKWNLQSTLPLQMCAISAILAGVVLLWRNQMAYEFLFYWGIPGAFHSLLTPEFTNGMEGFLFPEYYIAHGGIILSALYLTLVLGMKPRKGSWWRICIWSQIPIALVAVVNWILNANYMYLCQKPIVENPFLIGDWPWYILGLYVAGILHFLVIYAPFGIKYRRETNRSLSADAI